MFNRYENDQIIEHGGFKFRVFIEQDETADAPWTHEDGHGIVSDWTSRNKRAGERVLNCDRNFKRFYDVRATQEEIAVPQGWRCAEALDTDTRRQAAAKAVESDFQRLRAWCNNAWEYVAVGVQMVDEAGNDIAHPHAATSGYMGGIESDQVGDCGTDGCIDILCDEVVSDVTKYDLTYTPGKWV